MTHPRRIPRWIVENDPTWERQYDPNPTILRWNKKGTNIQAVSYPTSSSCEITEGELEHEAGLPKLTSKYMTHTRFEAITGDDLTKYLSSRYLNSEINNTLPGANDIMFDGAPNRRSLFPSR